MQEINLLNVDDAENLGIEDITRYASDYLNPNQSNIYSKLPWGKDLFTHAEGMYMYTKNGKKILDFTGGIGVLNIGHNHPKILETRIKFQENKRMEVHKLVFSPYMVALCKNLSDILPGDLNKTFICNSGAEAIEGALKLAFKSFNGKRNHVLHSEISYHGRLIASGSISGAEDYEKNFQKIPYTDSFIYNDFNSLYEKVDKLRDKNGKSLIYSIVIETFSAAMLTGCSEEFIFKLSNLCKKEDIILIVDEVYVGWGKTGYLFNFFKYKNFQPDIITTSKAIGGGKSSISAFVTSDKIYKKAYGSANDAFLHTTTYNGFGEECATALEAINIIIKENYSDKAKDINKKIIRGLEELKEKYPTIIKEIRGLGCINGIKFASPYEAVEKILQKIPIKFIQDKNKLINKITSIAISYEMYERFNILIFIKEVRDSVFFSLSPSFIVTNEEIERVLFSLDEILKNGLAKCVSNFYKNMIKEYFIK